jgi:hypothetical protein
MTVQVTMLQTRLGEDGTLWTTGQSYSATDAFARLLVSSNLATATFPAVAQSALTAVQVQAVQALIDGGGTDVSFTRAHDSIAGSYVLDAGAATVLPLMRLTVEAPTDVIAGARISAGGINTFETLITGASLAGEVIPISVGSGRITKVHIGSSAGASQSVASSANVTVNQLGVFSCLESDDCNVIYVRFAPPRVSGRYCDVSIVGKRRG